MRSGSLLIVIAFLFILSGCSSESDQSVVRRSGEAPIANFSDSDPEMTAAMERARAAVDDFIAELATPNGNRIYFVKIPLENDEHSIEHIWVDNVTYKDGVFSGKLANEPLAKKDLTIGSPVSCNKDRISDWMIIEGEKALKGGYTVNIARKKAEGQ